jgi:diaminopimelate decarboxylase
VNTGEGVDKAAEKMVGGPSKFGFDQETLVSEILELDLKHTSIIGIHVYTASGVLDEQSLFANFERTLTLAAYYRDALDLDLSFIDFGGGFGVPYDNSESELDIFSLGRMINDRLESSDCPIDRRKVRLIWELGRYLVAECGIYITKVLNIKESRGRRYLITDGGMNQQIRPVFMDLNHPTLLINKLDLPETTTVDIGGPCCTPIDMLAKNIGVPEPQIGDLVGVFNSGAYGFSMSMLYFLSHPLPSEVVIYKGESMISRHRGGRSDGLINQVIPEFLQK